MQTISRRRKEGTLKELIYRKPPSPEPEAAEPTLPVPNRKAKGSVAMELVQEDLTAYGSDTKPEMTLKLPTEDPVEDEVVDVPGKADLNK